MLPVPEHPLGSPEDQHHETHAPPAFPNHPVFMAVAPNDGDGRIDNSGIGRREPGTRDIGRARSAVADRATL